MRVGFWRRLAAALVLALGVGVAAPSAQASATSIPAPSTPASEVVTTQADWWW
jgi:hypothetical protein